MRRSRSRSLGIGPLVLAVLAGTWSAAPALAHKVVVFATGAGKAIEGEVYFHGGEAARDVKVTLLGPDDQVLGQTKTDQEGKFRLPIRFRCDYQVIADAGAGHGARYTVPSDELAADLPLLGKPDGEPQEQPEEARPATLREVAATAPQATSRDQPGLAEGMMDRETKIEELARQVAALRSDLQKYKNELRLRDVLGGIGYILGIMGTAFYFLGVRRKEKRSATADS